MKLKALSVVVMGVAIYLCLGGGGQLSYAQGCQDARRLVRRVDDDLRRLDRRGARNDKERERVYNARKHLSDFERNLSANRFDKDRLDSAIDDVKNVVEHNSLDGRNRDALSGDLNDLRGLREQCGH